MAAAVALDQVRSRLLSEPAEPASAATLANRLGNPRQKIKPTHAITHLAAKYHDEQAPDGRPHRLVAVAYPMPPNTNSKEPS